MNRLTCVFAVALSIGCGDGGTDPRDGSVPDGSTSMDASIPSDSGAMDGGAVDGGMTSADASTPTDAGMTDAASIDAGPPGPRCGDGVLDVVPGEQCDDGNTTDGDGCDASCQLETVGGSCGDSTVDAPLEKCDPPEVMPADGDGCNATCNLSGRVTTLSTVRADAITSNNTHLFLAVHDCPADLCGIARINIAACNSAPGTAACDPTFISGGPGRCACSTGTCPWGPNPPLTPAPAVVDGSSIVATFDGMGSIQPTARPFGSGISRFSARSISPPAPSRRWPAPSAPALRSTAMARAPSSTGCAD